MITKKHVDTLVRIKDMVMAGDESWVVAMDGLIEEMEERRREENDRINQYMRKRKENNK